LNLDFNITCHLQRHVNFSHLGSPQWWRRVIKLWTDTHTLPNTNPLRRNTSRMRNLEDNIVPRYTKWQTCSKILQDIVATQSVMGVSEVSGVPVAGGRRPEIRNPQTRPPKCGLKASPLGFPASANNSRQYVASGDLRSTSKNLVTCRRLLWITIYSPMHNAGMGFG
jgi:hypothetical protein